MPLLDLFWTLLWFFLFIAWIWLLIAIFADIFRSEMSGWGKAGWIIFVVVLPFLGVLIYLIANGDDMQNRAVQAQADQEAAQRAYIQDAAGSGGSSADELEKLASLHQQGVLTDEEYQTQKAKLLT
jgi:hypothetical protein